MFLFARSVFRREKTVGISHASYTALKKPNSSRKGQKSFKKLFMNKTGLQVEIL